MNFMQVIDGSKGVSFSTKAKKNSHRSLILKRVHSRKRLNILFMPESNSISETVPAIKGHSTWIKLLRVTARILRRVRAKPDTFLDCEQKLWSQKFWWKVVECSKFPTNLKNLRNAKPNKNGRLHQIRTFLDNDGIMRICSRVSRMKDTPQRIEKEPIVLDGDHSYT